MVTRQPNVLTLAVCFAVLLLLAGGVLLSANPVQAAGVLYVAPGAACGGATPCYASVQAAVDAAQSGDEIRIAAGAYSGVNNQGGKAQVVYIAQNLSLRGGFTPSDWENADPETNITELNAQTLGRVVYVAESVTVTLDGLHLTYGNATGLAGHTTFSGSKDAGGGLYAYNTTLSMTNCQVRDSSTPSSGTGGGLYARETTLLIENCHFEENTSGDGGAAELYLSTSTVKSSYFIANQMSGVSIGDFGISVDEGSLVFSGNTLDGNYTVSGAGSVLGLSEVVFEITGNQILGTASGAQAESGVGLSYSSGTFSRNYVANHRNQGVQVFGGYVVMSHNEIAYNNGRPADYGGGVSFGSASTASQLIMAGNHIHHNIDRYLGRGGGVYINSSEGNEVYLIHNLIEDNLAGDGVGVLTADGEGGGVYLAGNYVTLTGNIIRRNISHGITAGDTYGGRGGGVYLNGNGSLINNLITDNQARFAGSGVYVNGATPYLYHNTIANNFYPGGDGSGVFAAESFQNTPGQPRLYNTIISNQVVGAYADQGDVSSVIFMGNVLWYDNDQDTGGAGAVFVNNPFNGDPLYVDVPGYDYHLSAGSAAIDHGSSTSVVIDIDNEPHAGVPDLGADEYWAPGALKRMFLALAMRP